MQEETYRAEMAGITTEERKNGMVPFIYPTFGQVLT